MSVLSRIYVRRAEKLEAIIIRIDGWINNPALHKMSIEIDEDILRDWIDVLEEAKDKILVDAREEE